MLVRLLFFEILLPGSPRNPHVVARSSSFFGADSFFWGGIKTGAGAARHRLCFFQKTLNLPNRPGRS